MSSNSIHAGALALVLLHQRTGCPHSARRAADLLQRLANDAELDADSRALFEHASEALLNATVETRPCA